MKIEKAEVFSPVTITFETEQELAYIKALSNTSLSKVRESAKSLGVDLDHLLDGTIQMRLFNSLNPSK